MAPIVPYLLLGFSILLETGKNIFSNNFSKNVLKNETDIYKFNFFMYAGAVVVLSFLGQWKGSWFSLVLPLRLWVVQCFM